MAKTNGTLYCPHCPKTYVSAYHHNVHLLLHAQASLPKKRWRKIMIVVVTVGIIVAIAW